MSTTLPDLQKTASCLPEELLASTLFLLAQLGIAIKARVIREFEEAGFGMYQYGVLATLGEGASETQATIADVLSLDRSQLVHILDELEERGLIERQRDPSDRRRHTVSLTRDGKRQLGRLRKLVAEIENAVLEPLGADDRKVLHDTLLTVAAHGDPRFARP